MSKFKEVLMGDENLQTWVDPDNIIGIQKCYFPEKSALSIGQEERPHNEFWAVNFVYCFNALHGITQPAKIFDTEVEADDYIKSIVGDLS